MQFIVNGPEALLQAHEEGKVAFFCGAGISYRVGLKDFKTVGGLRLELRSGRVNRITL